MSTTGTRGPASRGICGHLPVGTSISSSSLISSPSASSTSSLCLRLPKYVHTMRERESRFLILGPLIESFVEVASAPCRTSMPRRSQSRGRPSSCLFVTRRIRQVGRMQPQQQNRRKGARMVRGWRAGVRRWIQLRCPWILRE